MRTPTLIVLGVIAATVRAHAAPSPDADPDLHEWFEHQHSVAGAWCCNVADGMVLADRDWRHAADQYEVRIDGQWRAIPPDALRDPHGGPNPTGAAIVWFARVLDDVRIFCFAPGFEY